MPKKPESSRDSLRKEALPALRAASDTQRRVALLQATLDRVIAIVGELPGAGILRRMTTGRAEDEPAAPRPKPGSTAG